MCKCIACGAPIEGTRSWKVFEESYEGPTPPEETLCGVCLEAAKDCYQESFIPSEVRNELLKHWCLTGLSGLDVINSFKTELAKGNQTSLRVGEM